MAEGVFAPGHLGELTRTVPFETVDAVLAECGAVQERLRKLPARVVVYLLSGCRVVRGLRVSGVMVQAPGRAQLSSGTESDRDRAVARPCPTRCTPVTGAVRPGAWPGVRDPHHRSPVGRAAGSRHRRQTDPLQRTVRYCYDADGNRETVINARGVVSTSIHDALGRPTGTTYSDETPDVTTAYDAAGNRKQVTDAHGHPDLHLRRGQSSQDRLGTRPGKGIPLRLRRRRSARRPHPASRACHRLRP